MTKEEDKTVGYDELWKELPNLWFFSLTKGKFGIVDACDSHITLRKWFETEGYIRRGKWVNGRKTEIILHRHLLNPGKNVVDHKNGCGLDNRRCNIRIATVSQNMANRRTNPLSGFRGVTKARGKRQRPFEAFVKLNGKKVYLGSRHTASEAAELYDINAIKIHGEFARLNFPELQTQYLSRLSDEVTR